jgi:hypothetical protein
MADLTTTMLELSTSESTQSLDGEIQALME